MDSHHREFSTTSETHLRRGNATLTQTHLTQRGISIVLPAWNEEEVITETVMKVINALREMTPDFEVIVVNDGSIDHTGEIIEDLAKDHPNVRPIHNNPNLGYGGALATGFRAAEKELLFFMDSDGQFDIHDLAQLIICYEHGDGNVILGYRAHRQDPAMRLLNAWAWKQLVCTWFQFRVTDIDCAFKLMPTALVQAADVQSRSALINTELLAKFARMDVSAAEVPVNHFPREKGKATGANLRVIARAFQELYSLSGDIRGWQNPTETAQKPLIAPVTVTESDERLITNEKLARLFNTQTEDAPKRAIAPLAPTTLATVETVVGPTFSALPEKDSASRTITRGQIFALVALILTWGLGAWLVGMPVLVGTIAVITVAYLFDLVLTLFLALHTIHSPTENAMDDGWVEQITDYDWPSYTILCPLYREVEVVPQFVAAMKAMDYPQEKLQILFLTEEDDRATRDAIAAMYLPRCFEIITVPDGKPRTKPRACNYGLTLATGDYVVIYDAEDVPDPLQLKKSVLTFANETDDVACVQAKLNFYNPTQNPLTCWFTTEYTLWFDLTLPGLQWARGALPLGGTSNHFRTAVLRDVGAWDPFNVTEDCDLGLRLANLRLRTVMLDSTTLEEANSDFKNWLRQRSRWIKGYLQTYLVHMRRPARYLTEHRLRDFVSLQVVVGARSAMLYVNPLMWLLLLIYIAFRPIVEPTFHVLYPAPVFYVGVGCLVFGNFIYIYSYLVACARRHQYDLMIFALGVPLYWAMMSVAASIALYQLVFAPFYWEKTRHGLHLQAAAARKQRNNASVIGLAATLGNAAQNGLKLLDPPAVSDTQPVPTID